MTANRSERDIAATGGKSTEPDAATERKAKGSVTEAIGKLLGDDAARDRGAAEQSDAGNAKAADTKS